MKKFLQILQDIILFVPAMLAVLIMCVYGLFDKDELDPYL